MEYGLSENYGSETTDASLVTNHTIALSGLRASTTYHYRVASTDSEGNGPTYSEDRTFTTSDIVVSIPDHVGSPGSEVTFLVNVNDLTNQDITSVSMTITFDAQLLTATGASVDGTLTASWGTPNFSSSDGMVQVSLSGASAISGSGTLLRLQFQVSPTASVGTSSSILFSQFQFNNGQPIAQTRGGTFTVHESTPPVITAGPDVASVSATSAAIEWATDEDATSMVEYGSTTAYDYQMRDSDLSRSHRTVLLDLRPAATYHYRVGSVDASGNGPTFSVDQFFTTAAGADVLVSMPDTSAPGGVALDFPVRVSDTTEKSIFTVAAAISYDPELLNVSEVIQSGTMTTSWKTAEVTFLPGLVTLNISGAPPLRGSGVLFKVRFEVAEAGLAGQESLISLPFFRFNRGLPQAAVSDGSFTHLGGSDATPPSITAGPFVDVVTSTAARISWITNEPSTGVLQYGTDTSYGSTEESSQLTTAHSIRMSGLNLATTYHFRVGVTDANNNGPNYTGDLQFTTNNGNAVTVSLPDVSAGPGQTFEAAIQLSDVSGFNVFSADLTIALDPNFVEAIDATSSGTLSDSWGPPVFTLSSDRIIVAMGGVTPLAGAGSLVKLRFRVKQDAPLSELSWIRFNRFVFNEGTPVSTTVNGRLTVTDTKPPQLTQGPLVSYLDARTASISWTTDEEATAKIEYGRTSTYGSLKESGILRRQYSVTLGDLEPTTTYHFRVLSYDALGNGPTLSSDLTFSTFSDQIFGQVVDEFENPVAGALIIANSPAGGGTANSDTSGIFKIDGLMRSNSYELNVTKFGFAESVLEDVPGDTVMQVFLTANYASLSGTVTTADGSSLDSVLIEAALASSGQVAYSASSQSDGYYELSKLLADTYIISAFKMGYIADPSQVTLSFNPGEAKQLDFTLEEADIKELEISGPQLIANNQSVSYNVVALTAGGQAVNVTTAQWAMAPALAGEISDGLLVPNPGYFGEAVLTVSEKLTGIKGTLSIDIFAPIEPQSDIVLTDSAGLQLEIRPGSVESSLNLQISHPVLNPLKRRSRSLVTVGSAYQLKPDGTVFLQDVRMGLPITDSYSAENLSIGYWDKNKSNWQPLENQNVSGSENMAFASITQLGLYSLLIPTQPLGISDVRFRPNPFSPDVDTDGDGKAGLTVEFQLSSNESSTPALTVKIYNVRGELVRDLLDNRPLGQGLNLINWDGMTNHGRMARNGRYIVQILAGDSSGDAEYVGTVVLVR
ncbi:MAG: cohesin domain-containing protein [bacterium]